MKRTEPRGSEMEERLRHYFIGLNFFVLRGVKYQFNEFDVTDVDLWLYSRTSPLSRERSNVDIKNRRTPQALERIFWSKGLQNALKLERCIVATTDSRADVTEFGLRNDVSVLDGKFLSRLERSDKSHLKRLTEEAFLAEVENVGLGKLGGNWKGRYEAAKSRVLVSLNFDGCNAWLNDIRYFLEQTLSSGRDAPTPWRLTQVCIGLLLISIDFLSKDLVGTETEQRRGHMLEGFRYGEAGREFTQKLTRVAVAIVGSTGAPGASEIVRNELESQTLQVRAELLAEFFSRANLQSSLFELAKEFEASAFSIAPLSASTMSTHAQSVIGVLADFFGIDRKLIFSQWLASTSATAMAAARPNPS